jgi:hypothetical protein
VITLPTDEWRAREAAHHGRADAATRGWRERAGTASTPRQAHPVDDFLFTYYPYKPAKLRRWHPGAGIELEGGDERLEWSWYRVADRGVVVDDAAYVARHGSSIRFVASLLQRTAARPGQFGCFGLHEWAMVHRQQGEHRHPAPLRLSPSQTDAVVESHRISCSHFDAFRFFTPTAAPLNRLLPTRENQPMLEQPGCLHAGMDVYKWAIKLGPLVPGELLLDCFELARDIRDLDMRAAPYDLRAWGYEPVAIETAEGKAEYVRRQRTFADRSNALRVRLLDAIRSVDTDGALDTTATTATTATFDGIDTASAAVAEPPALGRAAAAGV